MEGQGSNNKPIGCGASEAYAAGPDDEEEEEEEVIRTCHIRLENLRKFRANPLTTSCFHSENRNMASTKDYDKTLVFKICGTVHLQSLK
jgi:hypothetical protein